ncbi:hypothetical protein P4S72_07130 [Vibrio sp. PP-XX7]
MAELINDLKQLHEPSHYIPEFKYKLYFRKVFSILSDLFNRTKNASWINDLGNVRVRMIKILIIAPRFGTIHRGLETYVKELISNIDKTKFDITIVSAEHNEKFKNISFKKYHIFNREKFDFIFKYKVLERY